MNGLDKMKLKNRYRHGGELLGQPPLRECTEILIPVPWGHIVGNWYGPRNVQPVLAAHGWMDNAGAFDYLAALLPDNMAFLAIDLPGHGLSSRLPDGCFYHLVDYLTILRMIMAHFKWPKISLIAHSFFGSASYLFAAIFPDLVNCIINIDNLKPFSFSNTVLIDDFNNRIDEFLRELERSHSRSEPPSYEYNELVERLYEGTFHSVSKERSAYMLARNIQLSDKYNNRYFFVRDRRVKSYNYHFSSHSLNLEMATRISCPFMFIIARQSKFLASENHDEYREIIKVLEKNPDFSIISRDGTHHLHFNNPEAIISPVLKFLHRYAAHSFATEADATTLIASKL